LDLQGRIIDGRYEVESVLGRGGMGVVVKARHRFTGARVAVKLMHPHLMQGDLANRFLAEAQAPAAIGHPGIVSITDAGVTPEGELYLVMELLEGMPLRELMKSRRLTLGEIRRVSGELLAALGAAHAAGFIHRDLKPENIFVTRNGTVKLLDFGIAKILADGIDQKGSTAAGSMMGTLAYMAPEQLRDARTVDARADLWAAGVILYEMLTGALPYSADSFGNMVLEVMSRPPTPLANWVVDPPPEVDAALSRSLAREPGQRFQSAAEMAACTAGFPAVEAPLVVRQSALMPTSAPTPSSAFFQSQPSQPSAMATPMLTPAAVAVSTSTSPPAKKRGAGLLIALGILGAAAIGIVVGVIAAGGKSTQHHGHREKQIVLAAADSSSAAAANAASSAPAPIPLASSPVASLATPSVSSAKSTTSPKPTPVVTHQTPVTPVASSAPAVVVASIAPPPPPPPAAKTDAEACASGCALLKSCGMYVDASCQAACLSSPGNVSCARNANECSSAAGCVFASVCGGRGPSGSGSCATAANCEGRCAGTNSACLCSCAQAMSASHAAILLQLNDCNIGCMGDPRCMEKKCPNTIRTCLSQ
jgi:serine/threonine-protein kinase